jgi:tetratricopeptide (TPR) repeat protein
MLETIMRLTPAALALAALLATVSSVGISQKPDSQITPLSLEWQAKGEALRLSGSFDQAADAFESALAADPRNRKALIALAEIARKQGLQGKAIRFYGTALLLNPADIEALGGQGQAMVEKGAITNANTNLSRMKSLCRGTCPEIGALTNSIAAKSAQAEAGAKQGAETLPQNP